MIGILDFYVRLEYVEYLSLALCSCVSQSIKKCFYIGQCVAFCLFLHLC